MFLTGQNEISGFCRKLEGRYGKKALEDRKKRRIGRDAGRGPVDVEEERKTVSANQGERFKVVFLPAIYMDCSGCGSGGC